MLDRLFDALYSRLLLRDAFGKVLPGMIWLSAIVVAAGGLPFTIALLMGLNAMQGLLLLGFGWIVGFAVQSSGKVIWPPRLRTQTYPPGTFADREQFAMKLVEFHRTANEHESQTLERFVIIKEAAGNMYMAVLLAAATIGFDWASEAVFLEGSSYPPLLPAAAIAVPTVASLLGVCALHRQHRRASETQVHHIKAVLDRQSDRHGTQSPVSPATQAP